MGAGPAPRGRGGGGALAQHVAHVWGARPPPRPPQTFPRGLPRFPGLASARASGLRLPGTAALLPAALLGSGVPAPSPPHPPPPVSPARASRPQRVSALLQFRAGAPPPSGPAMPGVGRTSRVETTGPATSCLSIVSPRRLVPYVGARVTGCLPFPEPLLPPAPAPAHTLPAPAHALPHLSCRGRRSRLQPWPRAPMEAPPIFVEGEGCP